MAMEFFKKNTLPFLAGLGLSALALWFVFDNLNSNRLANLKSDNDRLQQEISNLKEGKQQSKDEWMQEMHQVLIDSRLRPGGGGDWGRGHPLFQYREAIELCKKGEHEKGIFNLNDFSGKHPYYPYVHFQKAVCLFGMGKETEAENELEEFIKKASAIEKFVDEKPELYLYHSKALYLLGRKEESKEFLKRAAKLNPSILMPMPNENRPGLIEKDGSFSHGGEEWRKLFNSARRGFSDY